jgi:uncharacterized protein YaaN involved in tellurite resistance
MNTFERLTILYKELIELNGMDEIEFIRNGGKAKREKLEKEIAELENEICKF